MKQGFERGLYGQARAHANPIPIPYGAHISPVTWPWANHGPALMGYVRDFTGLALAQGNPTVPRVALTNPIRDWTGLANWVITRVGNVVPR